MTGIACFYSLWTNEKTYLKNIWNREIYSWKILKQKTEVKWKPSDINKCKYKSSYHIKIIEYMCISSNNITICEINVHANIRVIINSYKNNKIYIYFNQ